MASPIVSRFPTVKRQEFPTCEHPAKAEMRYYRPNFHIEIWLFSL